ncbi:MAG: hypothetical protein E7Z87_07215 [Cyanobacteria bacterium SIG26]|nr:hypothetical protein [Cyanobacteria bacterium SIG26]
MTEEVKTCDCKQKFIAKLKEFAFIAGAVFVGATLAILLSANILKPKYPCKAPMMPPPKMERHIPPHRMHHGFNGPREFRRHHRISHHARMHRYGDFAGRRDFKNPNFKKEFRPQPNAIEKK